jgi:hypothetical protein
MAYFLCKITIINGLMAHYRVNFLAIYLEMIVADGVRYRKFDVLLL